MRLFFYKAIFVKCVLSEAPNYDLTKWISIQNPIWLVLQCATCIIPCIALYSSPHIQAIKHRIRFTYALKSRYNSFGCFNYLGLSLCCPASRRSNGKRVLVQWRAISISGAGCPAACLACQAKRQAFLDNVTRSIQMDVRCRRTSLSRKRTATSWHGLHYRRQCRFHYQFICGIGSDCFVLCVARETTLDVYRSSGVGRGGGIPPVNRRQVRGQARRRA